MSPEHSLGFTEWASDTNCWVVCTDTHTQHDSVGQCGWVDRHVKRVRFNVSLEMVSYLSSRFQSDIFYLYFSTRACQHAEASSLQTQLQHSVCCDSIASVKFRTQQRYDYWGLGEECCRVVEKTPKKCVSISRAEGAGGIVSMEELGQVWRAL